MTNIPSNTHKKKPPLRPRINPNKLRKRPYYQTQLSKHLTTAKEMISQGDRIMAEYYFQHAEHYLRSISELESNYSYEPYNNDLEIETIQELQQ